MKILTIIVTYNGSKWIRKCIESIINSTVVSDIIIIDNKSTDITYEIIHESWPSILFLQSEENLGFAKANNIGLRYALDNGYDFAFLLNQDAWVENDTIEKLTQGFTDNTNAGILSPIHLNGNGSTLDYGFASYVKCDFVMDLYERKLNHYYSVPFVNAAAWMISKQCIETIGGFDTLLFSHYEEDGNYCQRLRYHGLSIYIDTTCYICHDREQRMYLEEYEGRKLWKSRNKYSFYKLNMGDINNQNIQLSKTIQITRIRRVIYRLVGRRKDSLRCKEEICVIKNIIRSREINSNKGPNWL